jgi:signal transduction histidine kinase/ActR/RegA family two-component response regulator
VLTRSPTRPPTSTCATSWLRWRYLSGLCIIAFFTALGYTLTVQQVAESDDATVINVAGKQRMLSQKIVRLSHEVHAARVTQDLDAEATLRLRLVRVIKAFETAHAGLQFGDARLGVPGSSSPVSQHKFEVLGPMFDRLVASARRVLAADGSPEGLATSRAALEDLSSAADAFLPWMHNIVNLYEAEYKIRHARFLTWERWMVVTILIIVLLEAFFVFEPAARMIERQIGELRLRREEAESAGEAKERFLANMSHEIRTPIAALLGHIELAQDPACSPKDREDHLKVAMRSGCHLTEVVNDVLDLCKFNAGEMRVRRESVETAAIVCDVMSTMRVRAAAGGLDLRHRFHGELPRTILTDEMRLRQALYNLVGNAIKFTEHGSVTLDVGMNTDGMVTFSVTDTGPGMTRDQLRRVFRAFTQADDGITRQHGGTGLGLTITRRIAEALGGRIHVKSEPGVGSVFTLEIDPGDLEDAELVEDPGLAVRATPETASPVTLEGLRVLLVEDNSDIRRLIGYHLRSAGADLTEAHNGEEGVRAASDPDAFDVIFMDMQMPVLDGCSATVRLRAMGVGTPILALTANAFDGDRERCLEAGCDAFLSKPIDRKDLLAACRAWGTRASDAGSRPAA